MKYSMVNKGRRETLASRFWSSGQNSNPGFHFRRFREQMSGLPDARPTGRSDRYSGAPPYKSNITYNKTGFFTSISIKKFDPAGLRE